MTKGRLKSMRRAGFGILEIVILLAVATIVTVLTIPIMAQADRTARVKETWDILEHARVGAFLAGTGFRQQVGRQPGRLSQLTTPITTADLNSCGAGNNFTNAQVNNWDGPYGGMTFVSTGLPTPVGTGQNLLVRDAGGNNTLGIYFYAVDTTDAHLLDVLFDDGVATTGSVRWSALGVDTLKYYWDVNAAC